MAKQKGARGVNHRPQSGGVYSVLIWLYDFRIKYNFSEAGLYDLIFVYWYCSNHQTGVSATQIMLKRYGQKTQYVNVRARLETLIKRGLVYRLNRKIYPSELLLKEMSTLELPEALLACFLASAA